jgi:hypothetical protein
VTGSQDQEEREEEMAERLHNILLIEQSTGCKPGPPNERLINELTLAPKRHLVWSCVPHYFHALKRRECMKSLIIIPDSVPRVGSVLVEDETRWWDDSESKLFVASHLHAPSPSGSVIDKTMSSLIGLATSEAQIGDEIVRFLE